MEYQLVRRSSRLLSGLQHGPQESVRYGADDNNMWPIQNSFDSVLNFVGPSIVNKNMNTIKPMSKLPSAFFGDANDDLFMKPCKVSDVIEDNTKIKCSQEKRKLSPSILVKPKDDLRKREQKAQEKIQAKIQ